MQMINGSEGPDERDASELFPHTRACIDKVRMGGHLACTCPARQGRRNFLYLIRRARMGAYVDAYAKIRHEAKRRAERSSQPLERQVFEEVASWAEQLEIKSLEDGC